MAIRVELQLDDGNFVTRMIHAGETVRQFNMNVARSYPSLMNMARGGDLVFGSITRAGEASKGFLASIRDISIVFGMFSLGISRIQSLARGFLGDIIRVNAETERMNALMRSMSGSSDPVKDAAANVAALRREAMQVPFSLKAIQDTAVKLRSVGIDPMAGSLRSLEDAIAAFGGGDEALKRATLAMQQMSGKGVIQMEELRQQLGEAVPRATELMARSMGVTYGQLMQKIATGTVIAGPALEALRLEFDRTFGGDAQRMMQTWNGQLIQSETLLQLLAQRVGEAGFFGEMKTQLKDFNDFLGGDIAGKLADDFGAFLTSGVQGLRSFINTIVDLRHEIMAVGEAMLYVFAGRLVLAGITTISGAIMGLITNLGVVRVQAALAGAQLANINMLRGINPIAPNFWAQGMTMPLRNAGTAMGFFGGMAARAAAILPVLASGFSTLLPWVVGIGLAAYAAAEYFDLFGQKAKRAWEDLEQFGAQSRQQVDEAFQYIENLKTAIENFKKGEGTGPELSAWDWLWDPENAARTLRDYEIFVAEMEKKRPEFERAAERKQAQAASRQVLDILDNEMDQVQQAYDDKGKLIEEQVQKELRLASEAGRATDQINAKHREDTRANELEYYDNRLAVIKRFRDEQVRLAEEARGVDRAAAEETLRKLAEMETQTLRNKTATMALAKGVTTVPKEQNLENLLKKAEEHLDRIRAETAGFKAELAGASNESGKLAYQLQQGRYGGPDSERVREFIDALIEAQAEYDRFNEKLEGQKKLESDLDKALADQREQIFEAQTRNLSEADKIALRIATGQYPGVGPQSPMERLITGMKTAMEGVTTATNSAAVVMRDALFGSNMQTLAEAMIGRVERLAGAWGRVGMNAATFFAPLMGGAGSFLSKLFQVQSMSTGSTVQPPTPNTETVAERNSTDLAQRLGVETAVRIITAPLSTMVSTLLSQQQMAANPDFAGKTAGEILAGGGERMGALGQTNVLIDPNTLPIADQFIAKFKALIAGQQTLNELTARNAMDDYLRETQTELDATTERVDGLGKRTAALYKMIEQGKFGPDTDPNSARYAKMIALTKEWDAAETSLRETKRTSTEFDNQSERLAQSRVALLEREMNALARINDPNELKQTSAYRRELALMDEYVAAAQAKYGADSEAYRRAVDEKIAHMQRFRNAEMLEVFAGISQKTVDTERSLLTDRQQREAAMNEEIARIQYALQAFQGAEEQRVLLVAQSERYIAALRAQFAQSDPVAAQFKQWQDIGGNFQRSMAGWIDSIGSNMANMLTGAKVSWKSTIDSIINDLARLATNWALSMMLGGGGAGGAKGGGGAKQMMQLFATAHTGGIAGGALRGRFVNPAVFAGAPKFHAGGIAGMNLGPDEVPIIARRGEGIFTPEQMQAMGNVGPRVVKVESHLHANGGTPEQNADLAEKVTRQMENTVRQIFNDELSVALRPGGRLNH